MKELTKKQEEVLNHIIEFAHGNFEKRLPVTDDMDFYSGLAVGLNMVGEYLLDYSDQISEKTKHEKLLAEIIRHSNEAVISTDLDGNIKSWNPAAEGLYGYSSEEILGKNIEMLMPENENEKAKAKDVFRRTIEGTSFERIDAIRRHKSGRILNISLTVYPLKNLDNEIIGRSATSYDRTPELEAEKNRDLLINIIDNAHDAIIRLNRELEIESWNKGAQKMIGATEQEMVGKPAVSLFPSQIQNQILDMLSKVLNNETYKDAEALAFDHEGHMIHVSITMFPLLDNQLNVLGVALMIKDITANFNYREMLEDDIKVKTRTLNKTIKQLSRSNKALREFAYVASHDLKSPLRGIANMAQFIEEDVASGNISELREQVKLLISQVHRMDDLINGILKVAMIQGDENDNETTNIEEIIEIVRKDLASHTNFTLKTANDLPTIMFNQTKALQVFSNLIGNAIKHNNKDEIIIEIGCSKNDDGHTFSIKDNGPGIEKSHFDRIFNLFQTLSRTDDNNSTGIGLAIVKRIVENAGGSVWVDSALGEGTTFHVQVPV